MRAGALVGPGRGNVERFDGPAQRAQFGLVKKKYLAETRSEAEVAIMRGIKRVLDPHGIMNPGKVFDTFR